MARSPRNSGTRKPKAAAKRVKDHKRGKASDNYEVDVEGDDTIGHNSKNFVPERRALSDYLDTIDEQDAIIADIMQTARKKCQGPRGAVKTARKRMIEDGYHAKELDTLVRKHRLERKVEAVADSLDDEQVQFFRALEKALGPLADTPLGQAAIAAGGERTTDDETATEDEFA